MSNGVTIIGPVNIPSSVPGHASQMFSRNVLTLLQHMIREGELVVNRDDEILGPMLVSAPVLLASFVVGIIMSFLQAIFQIHEYTFSFVPKLLAIFVEHPGKMYSRTDLLQEVWDALPAEDLNRGQPFLELLPGVGQGGRHLIGRSLDLGHQEPSQQEQDDGKAQSHDPCGEKPRHAPAVEPAHGGSADAGGKGTQHQGNHHQLHLIEKKHHDRDQGEDPQDVPGGLAPDSQPVPARRASGVDPVEALRSE